MKVFKWYTFFDGVRILATFNVAILATPSRAMMLALAGIAILSIVASMKWRSLYERERG